MKSKSVFICVAILFFNQVLSAQIMRNYGVKAAFTSSNINYEQLNDFFSRRSGINLAVFTELLNTPFFSLLIQAEYEQKGFLEEQAETNQFGSFIQTVKANTRLDYLSFPVLAKFRYSKGVYSPFVLFGPRLDYLINKRNGEYKFTSATSRSIFADHFDRLALGGTIGAGIELPEFSSFKTVFEIRYNFDFSDSYSKIDAYKVKNNSFDLWLGLIF